MMTPASHWLNDHWQTQALPNWLAALKEKHWRTYLALGLPDKTHEKWKYTHLEWVKSYLEQQRVIPSVSEGSRDISTSLDTLILRHRLPHDSHFIVMVNGEIKLEYSDLSRLPKEMIVLPLRKAIHRHADLIQQHWLQLNNDQTHAFAHINAALCQDGLFVYVPDQLTLSAPIHLLSIMTNDKPFFANPHHLILLGEAAQCNLLEEYVAPSDTQAYFINSVTQVKLQHAAKFEHYKLVAEPQQAHHMAALFVEQQQDSQMDVVQLIKGGHFVRDDINVKLLAKRAVFRTSGFYHLQQDGQYSDQHIDIEHAAPLSQSDMFYKGIIDKRARAVFNGRLHVKSDAQKILAHQANHNLLLSNTAEIYSKPELEIYADDVKCKHGATVGQLDYDALFYMRARGIPYEEAMAILLHGFAEDILQRINLPSVKARTRELL